MTLAATLWPRNRRWLGAGVERRFEVEPGSALLGWCHWRREPQRHPTLVLIHGLEGSSDSPYMVGTAGLAFAAGFNVVRLNQRNCGGSERLTPTLYNSGLSGDLRAVVVELLERDRLPEVFLAGFSMGGNLALKMAGEMGDSPPAGLRAVIGVSPAFELAVCVGAIERRVNAFYHWHFVRSLKRRMRQKIALYPERYSPDGLAEIRSIREFDDRITAPHFGYRDADDYYFRASAARVLERICIPTLILVAQDDPMIPYELFRAPAVAQHPRIMLLAPEHGGHCGFASRHSGEERFWAEARIVEFCHSFASNA